ncbi:hypothetical protein BDZ97DRAFT_1792619, partial [Flammula alnicola]
MSPSPEEQHDSPRLCTAEPGQTLQNGHADGRSSQNWVGDQDLPVGLQLMRIAKTPCFPVLADHFYEQSPKGRHLCLVLHVLGPSVESFR